MKTELAEKLHEIKMLQSKKEILIEQVSTTESEVVQFRERLDWTNYEITNLTIEVLEL